MQVIESEIVIPFEYKSRVKGSLIFSCAMLVFVVGLFLFLILLASQMAAKASVTFADSSALAEKWTHQWITLEVWGIVILVLVLLLYSVLITSLIRKLHGPSPFLRINREGIFTSMGAFLLRWEEIKEFTLYTYLGYPVLGIVPWNAEAAVARAKVSSKRSRRFAIDLNQRLVRLAKSPAPFGIAQKALPISIDELITAIQEHFATELRTYHITVRNWQE